VSTSGITIAILPSSKEWLQDHQALLMWLGALSITTLIICISVLPVIVIRMSENHFLDHQTVAGDSHRDRHPFIRLAIQTLKNFFGLILVVAGIAMLALPGQGLLTIFLGLFVMNFPGKRALEILFLRIPGVLRRLNWIRSKADRPPLKLPPR